MNKVILIGRLTKDPELRYTHSGSPVCDFTLAVDRRGKGEEKADFIRCQAWGKMAEATAQYMRKGRQLGVDGRLQIDSFDGNDGQRKWITTVVCNQVEFLGSTQSEAKPQAQASAPNAMSQGVMDYATEVSFSDEDLPF